MKPFVLTFLTVIILTAIVSAEGSEKIIINEGSCNINIQGDNNRIDRDVLKNACRLNKIDVLSQRSDDGLSDFCLTSDSLPFGRKFCSIAFAGLESMYAFGEIEHPMLITGRYTGETMNELPHGKGEFIVSNLVAPTYLIFSFLGDPNLYDEFKKGNTLVMEGNWKNGLFTGEGEIIYPMGGTMKGRFQNSVLLDGFATNITRRSIGLVWLFHGDRYTGPIRNGKLHGDGGEIIEWTDENEDGLTDYTYIVRGRFSDGELYNGEKILSKGSRKRPIWIETFKNGKKVGHKDF